MPRRQRARFVVELQRARGGRVSNGAGHVPAGEPEPPEFVVWHEFLDQRKELSLLKPDVCVRGAKIVTPSRNGTVCRRNRIFGTHRLCELGVSGREVSSAACGSSRAQ